MNHEIQTRNHTSRFSISRSVIAFSSALLRVTPSEVTQPHTQKLCYIGTNTDTLLPRNMARKKGSRGGKK
eukprot:4591283-Pleurochrysis_carterae.AAC.2